MPLKLKIILGGLVLIAGFFVVKIGIYFNNSIESANTGTGITGSVLSAQDENPFSIDSDKDGISDVDESYYRTDPFNPDSDGDGYLDGEEIVSGFDPTKKDAKGNESALRDTNVTDNLTDRLIAGIFAGDLSLRGGNSVKYQKGMDLLTLAALDESFEALNPQIGRGEIKTGDDSKEAQEKYLRDASRLLEGPFLDSFLQQPQMLNRAVTSMASGNNGGASEIFGDLSRKFTTAYTQLLTITVPPSWVDFHKRLLEVFQKISVNYAVLSKAENDPVLAMVALNDFSNNMLDINISLVQKLRLLIRKGGLEIPKTPLFETIDILNYQTPVQ